MSNDKQLTERQARFVEEYLISGNASQAAIKAGYSRDNARSQGHENTTNPNIMAEIERGRLEMYARWGVTKDRISQEYARLGFSDARKLVTPTGARIPLHELDDDTAATVASVELVESTVYGEKDADERPMVERTHKIKTYDKMRALEHMGKMLGMFNASAVIDIKGLAITIADKDAECA